MKDLRELITQSRRICESSILSGKGSSIRAAKDLLRFDYDKLVELIEKRRIRSFDRARCSVHNYDELGELFDKDIPTPLLNLELIKSGLSVERISFEVSKDHISIVVVSTDKKKSAHNTEILTTWIGSSGHEFEAYEKDHVVHPGMTAFFNYIVVKR